MKFTLRFFFAALALVFFSPYDKVGAMLLAGTILAFPSWKFHRGRLAIGEQDKSPELEAIDMVSKQVEGFKKVLGDKLDKSEYDSTKATIEDLKKAIGDNDGKSVSEKIKEINTATEKMLKQITEMQEDVQRAKESGKAGKAVMQLFDPADVAKFVADTFNGSEKTGNKASFKLNTNIVLKAAEVFGYPQFFEGGPNTDITAFTGRFIDPELYQRRRKRNLILDNFSIETIGVPTLIYLEKVETAGDDASQEDVGGAEWIVSGGQKPMRSFRVTSAKVEAKKVAIFGTVEDKLLRDVPSLENWIREDFTDEMRETYNDALLNNNPAVNPDAPLGLKQNAIQYNATPAFTGTIVGANYIDMIVAAAAYMSSLKYTPERAFVSSDVFYAMLILKDTNERYQNSPLVYTNSLGQLYIAGVRIVIADEEDVPSTHLLMTGSPFGFRIKNYQAMVFERGLNGEDFRYDRTSFRAYQEVLSYIPSHRFDSVMYDTWDNIEAAISTS
jgi:HK97 family phage major capsid protein